MTPSSPSTKKKKSRSQKDEPLAVETKDLGEQDEDSTNFEAESPKTKKSLSIPSGDEVYSYELKIPRDRIAVIIGKKGEVKKELQENLGATLTIDSSEGDVTITGKEALALMTGRDIIRAIARGFNPNIALLLLKQDFALDIINLGEIARTEKDLGRLKGRIIGAGGKSRRVIEDHTQSHICVYGKTVSIIAEVETQLVARRAIEMLIEGSAHRNVYKWLERQRKTLHRHHGFGDDMSAENEM